MRSSLVVSTTPAPRVRSERRLVVSRQRALEAALLRRRPEPGCRCAPAPPGRDRRTRAARRRRSAGRAGSEAARRWCGGVDQAELLEVLHHVADRGRRQRHWQHARKMPRARPARRSSDTNSTMRRKISRERAFKFASAPVRRLGGRQASHGAGRMAVRAAARKTIGRARSSRAPLRDAQGCRNCSRPPKVTPSPSQDPTPLMSKFKPRTGGQILVDQLVAQGVERVFCVPGESYLAALDAIYDSRRSRSRSAGRRRARR